MQAATFGMKHLVTQCVCWHRWQILSMASHILGIMLSEGYIGLENFGQNVEAGIVDLGAAS